MNSSFIIQFKGDWFTPTEVLSAGKEQNVVILTHPKRVWWKFLLQVYSCHLYKADWEYKVKLL